MRYSQAFIPTSKDTPKDALIPSHQFLLRGGFIKQLGAGLYTFLPLGLRVLQKIEQILREEMNRSGCIEARASFVTPAHLWQKSGRWAKYGKELLKFQDRKEGDFVLGPTHEEAFVEMVKDTLKSYKHLPLHLYQIYTKFRDEVRPRFGLLRCREFVMKDGYSFHATQEDLKREFDVMEATYKRMFERMGLNFRIVTADSGAIGGSGSKEFMVLADTGEDDIVLCTKCEYAANIELATRHVKQYDKQIEAPFAFFHTPNASTIKMVSDFFTY